jgi:cell division protein FtsL
MSQATARPRTRTAPHRAPAQRPPAPRGPRRISGPVARPATAPAPALPRRRGNTGVFERLRTVPDHRVVDRLLRSRLWIIIVGALLGGIVAMQVSLLKLNSGISRAVETSATLERQNAALEASIARLGATERIRSVAATRGMVLPPAGEVRYVRVRPTDAGRAASVMTPPTEDARALLANGGVVPGSLAEEAVVGTATGTVATDATTTTDPTAVTATATTAPVTDPTATTAAAAATQPVQE